MKRGFTLIELLAVIVILGVIAIIAVPTVANVIEKSERGAAETSADQVINDTENFLTLLSMKYNDNIPDDYYSINDLLYDMEYMEMVPKGSLPESGWIYVENGAIVEASLYLNGYPVECDNDKCKVDQAEYEIDDIDLLNGDKIDCEPSIEEAPVVYFNPEAGSKCTKEEYDTNLHNYNANDIPTGLKTGCMKWYAYNTHDGSVDMILDHNTSRKTYNYYDPNDIAGTDAGIFGLLKKDTSTWEGVMFRTGETFKNGKYEIDGSDYRARLLYFTEIINLSGLETFISELETIDEDYYYFIHRTRYIDSCYREYKNETYFHEYARLNTSPSHYLYENTDCEMYGCEKVDNYIYGYYLFNNVPSIPLQDYIMGINYAGIIYAHENDWNAKRISGIRPVITIPESIIE